MTKIVRNMARPMRTWDGGMVCTPMALRVRPSTMTKRVNEVISSRMPGATAPMVSSRMIITVLLSPPLSDLTLMETSGTSST